jgi:Asp-tRNA(Asn)/Glu-tRNA(Gln) amidotransferase A subunit family amidase
MTAGSVLLTPLLTTVTPRHGWTYWHFFGALPFTFMFNALGFPAVVVPVGWTANGLPLVVQVVARPDEDEVALGVALELERVFGGWKIAAM